MNNDQLKPEMSGKIGKGNGQSLSMKRWVGYWPLLLPLLIYFPGILGWIPYPSPAAEYTDLLISHTSNAIYLKKALFEFRQIPLWSPVIFSGYPFAANPLSGLWYPPGWIALLFPLPQGLSILLALHALWGGTGMYILLREEGLDQYPALFGGIAFGLMPKISAHYGAGHVTLISAFAWTPWLLVATRQKKRALLSGLCLGAIFLADPRWAAFSGLLWTGYCVAYSQEGAKRTAFDVGKTIGLSGLLAGPLLVPLIQFVSLSTRSKMSPEVIFTHSTSFVDFIGLFFPSAGRTVENAMYPGGLVLMMVVLAVSKRDIRKRTTFWWVIVGISAFYALGSNVPGLEYLAYLPGFNLLRVPSRSLFIFNMALVILACYLLQEMLEYEYEIGRASFAIIGVAFFVILLLGGIGYLTKNIPVSLVWGMGSVALGVAVLSFRNRAEKMKPWLMLIFALVVVDGMGAAFLNLDFRRDEVMDQRVVGFLGEENSEYGQFRTYSPSYSIPQHIVAGGKLEMTDGVDPMQLEAYVAFMEKATGIPNPGYSVTLPPFPGDTSTVNKGYEPDSDLLGLLNVRYLVSAFAMPIDEFALIHNEEGLYVYRNQDELPRAWVQPQDDPVKAKEIKADSSQRSKADVIAWRPNNIILKAEGPGKLVLSEIAYPGWTVSIDGKASSWTTIYGILRGVEISEGEHIVEFAYRPKVVYLGLFSCLVGFCLIIRGICLEK